jgi:hypothetical protein
LAALENARGLGLATEVVERLTQNVATHIGSVSDTQYAVNGETYGGPVYVEVVMHIGERVRQRMAAVGIVDQSELCRRVKAAGGGLSQAQASQLLTGKTKRPRSLFELANVLQTTVAFLIQDETRGGAPVDAEPDDLIPVLNIPPQGTRIATAALPLVVFRTSAAIGRSGQRGEVLVYREKVGEVSRPAELQYSRHAFGFTIIDDESEPRYRRRDILMVDPSSVPAPDDDCLIVKDPAANPLEGLPMRLVRITSTHWIAKHFNGSPEQRLARSEWTAALRIFGVYWRGR